MALTYGFFNSENGDRKYNARQLSMMFDGLITDGVFNTVGSGFEVTPAGATGYTVNVGTGRAWYNHTWIYNDAITSVGLTSPGIGMTRVDLICLKVDESNRSASFDVISGVEVYEGNTPTNPTLPSDHYHTIAKVVLHQNIGSISSGDIYNKQYDAVTGLVQQLSLASIDSRFNALFEKNEGLPEQSPNASGSRWQRFGYLQQRFNTWFASVQEALEDIETGAVLSWVEKLIDTDRSGVDEGAFDIDDYDNITTLKISHGGTGGSTAAEARENLGITGFNIAYDSTDTGLNATNFQDAIDEILSMLMNGEAYTIMTDVNGENVTDENGEIILATKTF